MNDQTQVSAQTSESLLGAAQTGAFLQAGSDLRGLAAWEMGLDLVEPLTPSPPPKSDNVIIPH